MAFTYTTSTQTLGFTQAQLVTFLDGVMTTSLGYTQIDSYTSGSEFRVYSYATNGSAKGTFILKVEISATQVIVTSFDTWNSGTHTGTGATSSVALTWSTGSDAVVDKFVGTEGRFAVLVNNSNRIILGYIKPSTINSTIWPESTYRHCHLPVTSNLASTYISAGPNNVSSFSMPTLALTSVAAPTWSASKRQVWGPRGLYSSAVGMAGWFADISETGLSGIAYGDIIQVTAGVEEYFVIGASGNSAVLRTV